MCDKMMSIDPRISLKFRNFSKILLYFTTPNDVSYDRQLIKLGLHCKHNTVEYIPIFCEKQDLYHLYEDLRTKFEVGIDDCIQPWVDCPNEEAGKDIQYLQYPSGSQWACKCGLRRPTRSFLHRLSSRLQKLQTIL